MARRRGPTLNTAATARAEAIRDMCSAARRPYLAEEMIASGQEVEVIRRFLLDRLAAESGPEIHGRVSPAGVEELGFRGGPPPDFAVRAGVRVHGASDPAALTSSARARSPALDYVEAIEPLWLAGASRAEIRARALDLYDDLCRRYGFESPWQVYWYLREQGCPSRGPLRCPAPMDAPPTDEAQDAAYRATQARIDAVVARDRLPPPRNIVEDFDHDVYTILAVGAAGDLDNAARILARYGRAEGPHIEIAVEFRDATGLDIEEAYRSVAAGDGMDGHTGRRGRPRQVDFATAVVRTGALVRARGATNPNRLTALALQYFGRARDPLPALAKRVKNAWTRHRDGREELGSHSQAARGGS